MMLEMSLDKLKHETTHRLIRVYLCNVHSLSWYIPFQAVYHLRIAHLNLQTQITFKFHVVENIFHLETFPKISYSFETCLLRTEHKHSHKEWLVFLIKLKIVGTHAHTERESERQKHEEE